jgi:signal transduction histidine kinase
VARDSLRRSIVETIAMCLAMSLLVGFLFSIGHLTLERVLGNSSISALYALSIGVPANVIFHRLRPRLHGRPALGQWSIYAGVMLVLIGVGSVVSGTVLVVVGVADASQLLAVYRHGAMVSLAISVPITIGAITMSRMHERLDTSEVERQRALGLATEARLASLESRVRPHFLFNALNSAIALIPEDPRRAEDVLVRLSALLRCSLDAQDGVARDRLVALGEELRVVTDYLEIERVRFGERLDYEVDVPDELAPCEVPAFAIQTLVENSVKYAVSARKQGARITVRARGAAGRLTIEVRDDGPGFAGEIWRPGHGLDGLRARLAALYGGRARLVAPADAITGAAVRIEIAEAA